MNFFLISLQTSRRQNSYRSGSLKEPRQKFHNENLSKQFNTEVEKEYLQGKLSDQQISPSKGTLTKIANEQDNIRVQT